MARPRNFNEDQVLDGAVNMFRELGYEGTSVPELTAKLGICRQSLYKTFGDKRGLYLKALDSYGQREIDGKLELLESEGSPLENVRTLIRGFASLATTCPNEGCLTVTAMVETRNDPEIQAVVADQVERLEQGIQTALQRARDCGELNFEANPSRLARAITTALYGIGLLVRLPGGGSRIASVVSFLIDSLDDASTVLHAE
jgi:TetR/AcrR family transcriptional regulator, transcriptional repressor for nem operon